MAKTDTTVKIAMSPSTIEGFKALGASTGWTKISPDAAQERGWLLHWRAYPKLQAAGLLEVKVQETPKTGKVVMAKLTSQGKKVLKTLG